MTIEGSIALVLGASSGPGEATAQRLAATAGYKVYGTSRRGVQAGRPSLQMLPLDVTSDESVKEAVKPVVRQHGHIDVLLNNPASALRPPERKRVQSSRPRQSLAPTSSGLSA